MEHSKKFPEIVLIFDYDNAVFYWERRTVGMWDVSVDSFETKHDASVWRACHGITWTDGSKTEVG
ncbi:MAG: hypothetical protein GY906_18025 [bacterium]|nr:hypothetical protein [bacterium]